VAEPEQWPEALKAARAADPKGEVLVEAFIPGREWTVGVIGGEALPVVEIRAPNGWYGYTEKYTKGVTQYVFPESAEDAPLVAQCQVLALLAFQATGCRGVSRIDFRVTPDASVRTRDQHGAGFHGDQPVAQGGRQKRTFVQRAVRATVGACGVQLDGAVDGP
jgi:D-alanine-D-alanine ligase-like ATP-grasp enzyme